MWPFKKRDQPKHHWDYLVLIGFLSFAGVVVTVLNLSKLSLGFFTLVVTSVYVVWGITHHNKSGHVDEKIVLEYLGFALLVCVLVFTLVV